MDASSMRKIIKEGELTTVIFQPKYFGRSNFDLLDETIPEMINWTTGNLVRLRRYPHLRHLLVTGATRAPGNNTDFQKIQNHSKSFKNLKITKKKFQIFKNQ